MNLFRFQTNLCWILFKVFSTVWLSFVRASAKFVGPGVHRMVDIEFLLNSTRIEANSNLFQISLGSLVSWIGGNWSVSPVSSPLFAIHGSPRVGVLERLTFRRHRRPQVARLYWCWERFGEWAWTSTQLHAKRYCINGTWVFLPRRSMYCRVITSRYPTWLLVWRASLLTARTSQQMECFKEREGWHWELLRSEVGDSCFLSQCWKHGTL